MNFSGSCPLGFHGQIMFGVCDFSDVCKFQKFCPFRHNSKEAIEFGFFAIIETQGGCRSEEETWEKWKNGK